MTNPDVDAVEWLVTLATDIAECSCIVYNDDQIANGLPPKDCEAMEDNHAFEVR